MRTTFVCIFRSCTTWDVSQADHLADDGDASIGKYVIHIFTAENIYAADQRIEITIHEFFQLLEHWPRSRYEVSHQAFVVEGSNVHKSHCGHWLTQTQATPFTYNINCFYEKSRHTLHQEWCKGLCLQS